MSKAIEKVLKKIDMIGWGTLHCTEEEIESSRKKMEVISWKIFREKMKACPVPETDEAFDVYAEKVNAEARMEAQQEMKDKHGWYAGELYMDLYSGKWSEEKFMEMYAAFQEAGRELRKRKDGEQLIKLINEAALFVQEVNSRINENLSEEDVGKAKECTELFYELIAEE